MHSGEGIFLSNRAFFCRTGLFSVEPCILLSNRAFLCRTSVIIKGLRPVLEGFVVPMHEGACETGSQIPRA